MSLRAVLRVVGLTSIAGVALAAPPAVLGCPGDCDGGGFVVVGEVVTGVAIALGTDDLSACPSLDRDRSDSITIDESLSSVAALLDGCPATPTPTTTPTPTFTPTATPTPSPTVNLPPALVCTDLYKAFPNQPIELPIPVSDPDGGPLLFRSDHLPNRAELDESAGVFRWTPRAGDVGSYYVPYTVSDLADPPHTLTGQLVVQVVPLDACTIPVCDPATGCVGDLVPLTERCCVSPAPRLGPPVVSCPGGRALHVGRNRVSGFGRLRNCELLRVRNFDQTGAVVNLSFEASCIDASRLVDIRVRIETATRLLFDELVVVRLAPEADGYARVYDVTFPVLGPGPFFELEDAEALVTVTLTQEPPNPVFVQHQVRPRLTFDILTDLTDPAPIEPLITPDPCLTPTPRPSPTSTPTPTSTATLEATPTATDSPTTLPTPTSTQGGAAPST